MNSKQQVKNLLDCLYTVANTGKYSDKEVLFCKELYSEIKICTLGHSPKTDKEKAMLKSGIKISDKDAILAIKLRISNLIQSEL